MASIAPVIMAVILGVVLLFVGIYMVDVSAGIIPRTSIYDQTTATNSTVLAVDGGTNETMEITVSNGLSASNSEISFTITNSSITPAAYIGVFINGVSLQNVSIPLTNITTEVTGITLSNGVNNITFQSYTTAGNVTSINDTALTYYDSTTRTDIGGFYDTAVSNAGIAFSVFGLVLIIVGLVIAIRSLKDLQ